MFNNADHDIMARHRIATLEFLLNVNSAIYARASYECSANNWPSGRQKPMIKTPVAQNVFLKQNVTKVGGFVGLCKLNPKTGFELKFFFS